MRFPAKNSQVVFGTGEIRKKGTGEQGNTGKWKQRNKGTRERGNGGTGEQGNRQTGEQGDRGTGEQGNRACLWWGRTDRRKVTWLVLNYQNFSYAMLTKFSYSWCSAARESSTFNTQWLLQKGFRKTRLKHDFFGRSSGTSEKVLLFFQTKYSKRKFVFHFYKAISFILSRSFFR